MFGCFYTPWYSVAELLLRCLLDLPLGSGGGGGVYIPTPVLVHMEAALIRGCFRNAWTRISERGGTLGAVNG